MAIDGLKDRLSQLVRFEQAPKLEHGGGVRHGLSRQINADKAADGLRVIQCIFDTLVRQAKTLLGNVHPQHPLTANGWAPAAAALGVVWLNHADQQRPGRRRFDLRQKAVSSGLTTLGPILGIGETDLHPNHLINLINLAQPSHNYLNSAAASGD